MSQAFDDLFGGDDGDFDALDGAGALEKAAVVPPGAGGPPMDPSAGGAPPAGPGMGGPPPGDPAMGGAPPMDPAAAGGAPMDPALAAAAPDAAMQQMVQQAVQQQMGQQGTSPGAAGVAGKPAKPDVAVELQKVNEQVYKIGMAVTVLFNHMGIELPPAMMFGAPPATLDPALQAAAATPGAGLGDPSGGAAPPPPPGGAPPPDGGGQPKLAADLDLDFEKLADELASLSEAAEDVRATPKEAAPAAVGSSYGALRELESSPLSLASMLRRRALGS